MTKDREIIWLELRPQQNFTDDREGKMLEIIRYASEFALFVFCQKNSIRIIVRVPADEANLFRTVDGMSAERCAAPEFAGMVTKHLAPRNKGSMIPLIDPKSAARSNMYQKMWAGGRDSMLACFVCNKTKDALERINAKIRQFENEERASSMPLSSRKKAEHAAGIQKRDGQHGYYNCCIVFGMESSTERSGEKESAKESSRLLDKMIGSILLNSFAHRVSRRRVRLSSEKKGFLKKIVEILGAGNTIDPYTFVPRRMNSKGMVLTEAELAFFISFPQERDIHTINFEIGPTPTFVHGKTLEIGKTDLEIQHESSRTPVGDDTGMANS